MPLILAILLAPIQLPMRALEALDLAGEAAREIKPIHSELSQMREQTKPLGEVPGALDRLEERFRKVHEVVSQLEGEESHLNKSVANLVTELRDMHKTVAGLQDDVQRVTDRLPDPDRGPLEKAKDVITGGNA